MGKRLALGLLKGLLIGGALGAGLQYGLHWIVETQLLGFLIAMAAAGTTGVFAGKPPWHESAWIEATLKGMVGVGLGALAYWGLTYLKFEIPFPQLEGTYTLASLPVVFAPLVAGVYGSLVELDNTGSDDEGEKRSTKARVGVDEDEEHEAGSRRADKKKRKA